MDFSFTAEQTEVRERVVRFARSLTTDVTDRDRSGTFSLEDWKRCAAFGIQGLIVDKEHSGSEPVDLVTAMIALEALGYGCRDAGLCLGLNAQIWTVQLPIQKFGSAEQQSRFLPGLCSGEKIGVHAVTEEDAGSDLYSLRTQAKKVGDGRYVLNGKKRFVTLGPVADVALILATTDSDLRKWGLTAFLIERTMEGVTMRPAVEKMGLRTAPFGEILLEDCVVTESHRLGPEGAGFSLSNTTLEFERGFILSSQLGAMERQLEETIEHAETRVQFGRSIGKFQSVSNRIVEMKLRLETAKLLSYKVAWLKQQDKPAMLESALLKLYLSESFLTSGLDALRTFGGTGYLSATQIERDVRDAVGGVIYAGTSDIQRNIVAKLLGL